MLKPQTCIEGRLHANISSICCCSLFVGLEEVTEVVVVVVARGWRWRVRAGSRMLFSSRPSKELRGGRRKIGNGGRSKFT